MTSINKHPADGTLKFDYAGGVVTGISFENKAFIRTNKDQTISLATYTDDPNVAQELEELFANDKFDIVSITDAGHDIHSGLYRKLNGSITQVGGEGDIWEISMKLEGPKSKLGLMYANPNPITSDWDNLITANFGGSMDITAENSGTDGDSNTWFAFLGDWRESGGILECYTDDGLNHLGTGEKYWSDYTIQITVNQSTTDSSGIALRMNGNPTLSGYTFFISNTGNYIIFSKYDESNIEDVVLWKELITISTATDYILKVIAKGSRFDLFLDGVFKATVYDETYKAGHAGVVTTRASATDFDTLTVDIAKPIKISLIPAIAQQSFIDSTREWTPDGTRAIAINPEPTVDFVPFDREVEFDSVVRVWDTQDNRISTFTDELRQLEWIRVYDPLHQFRGDMVVENGLIGYIYADNKIFPLVWDEPYQYEKIMHHEIDEPISAELRDITTGGIDKFTLSSGTPTFAYGTGYRLKKGIALPDVETAIHIDAQSVHYNYIDSSDFYGEASEDVIERGDTLVDQIIKTDGSATRVGFNTPNRNYDRFNLNVSGSNSRATIQARRSAFKSVSTGYIFNHNVDERLTGFADGQTNKLGIYRNGLLEAITDYDIVQGGGTSYTPLIGNSINGFDPLEVKYLSVKRLDRGKSILKSLNTSGAIIWIDFDRESWDHTNTRFTDKTGNTNHAEIINGNPLIESNGKINECLDFERSNTERVSIIQNGTISGMSSSTISAYTIEAWINPETLPPSSGDIYRIGFVLGNAGATQFGLYLDNSSGTQRLVSLLQTTAGTTFLNHTVTLTTGQWYHVASTWDGTDLKTFINFAQVATTTRSGTVNLSSGVYATIGGEPNANTEHFDGKIDEWILSDYAKQPEELGVIAPEAYRLGTTYLNAEFYEDSVTGHYKRRNSFIQPHIWFSMDGTPLSKGLFPLETLGTSAGLAYQIGKAQLGLSGTKVGTNNISVSTVERPTSTMSVQCYLFTGTLPASAITILRTTAWSGTDGTWSLGLDSSKKPTFGVADSGAQIVTATDALSDNTIYLLTGTYDGSIVRLYVDGVKTGTNASASVTLTSGDSILGLNGASLPFDLWIDELIITEQVLTSVEMGVFVNKESKPHIGYEIEFETEINQPKNVRFPNIKILKPSETEIHFESYKEADTDNVGIVELSLQSADNFMKIVMDGGANQLGASLSQELTPHIINRFAFYDQGILDAYHLETASTNVLFDAINDNYGIMFYDQLDSTYNNSNPYKNIVRFFAFSKQKNDGITAGQFFSGATNVMLRQAGSKSETILGFHPFPRRFMYFECPEFDTITGATIVNRASNHYRSVQLNAGGELILTEIGILEKGGYVLAIRTEHAGASLVVTAQIEQSGTDIANQSLSAAASWDYVYLPFVITDDTDAVDIKIEYTSGDGFVDYCVIVPISNGYSRALDSAHQYLANKETEILLSEK